MAGPETGPGIRHGPRIGTGKGCAVTIALEDAGADTSSLSLPRATGISLPERPIWIKP